MPELNDIIKELKSGASDIVKAASEIGKDSIENINGFSQRQLEGLANHTLIIGKGVANGDLTKEEAKSEFENLKKLTKNFTNVLVGLLAVTIEKIWNAMVKILQGVIKAIAGLVL